MKTVIPTSYGNNIDPHDFDNIYDYTDALPVDEEGWTSKSAVLKRFHYAVQNGDKIIIVNYMHSEHDTDVGDECFRLTMEKIYADPNGKFITDGHGKARANAYMNLKLMLSEFESFTNFEHIVDLDQHVGTHRSTYKFNDNANNATYVIERNTQINN